MARLATPDTHFEDIRSQTDALWRTATVCQSLLGDFAHNEQPSDFSLAEEKVRVEGLVEQKKALEDNLARFLRNLDLWALQLDADFQALDIPTWAEKLAGFFSARRKQRMQDRRMRQPLMFDRFRDLLRMSDAAAGLLTDNRARFRTMHADGETALLAVVERQRRIVDATDIAQMRIVEIQRSLRGLEMRLGEPVSPSALQRLSEGRRELTEEFQGIVEQEKLLLAESGHLDAHIALFQVFVDALNDAIASHNTLVNKTMAEAEHRIAFLVAAHEAVTGKTVALDQKDYRSLAAIIDKLALGILTTRDIPHRRQVAEEAFARRFTVAPLPSE